MIKRNVEFCFYAPGAVEVSIAGEFNNWNLQTLPMKKHKDGIWKKTTKLLPGRYEYKMLVDRSWIEDLPGEEKVPNPFGTQNFVRWVE